MQGSACGLAICAITGNMSVNRSRMGKLLRLICGLVAASSVFAADAVDEEKPHGRICLSIFEPGPPEKEEAFSLTAAPGAGKTVRAYVDSSDKCSVLVVALTKDGKLVDGWRPQLSEVPPENEEIVLPKAPVRWDWATASGPFDFYAIFLAPDTKEIDEARKLIEAMQNPKVDDRVLAMQTTKLSELGRLAAIRTQQTVRR